MSGMKGRPEPGGSRSAGTARAEETGDAGLSGAAVTGAGSTEDGAWVSAGCIH